MTRLDAERVRQLALGCGILSAGGGGEPRTGLRMAEVALAETGPVELIDLDDLAPSAFVLPVAMVGAPTILAEKLVNGREGQVLCANFERLQGVAVQALMCVELGGVNGLLPVVWAARAGLPLVDADGMGRAFPELPMTSMHLAGVSVTPCVLTDERANVTVIDAVSNQWAERIARGVATAYGGVASVGMYPMTAARARTAAVRGSLSRAIHLGRRLEESPADPTGVVLADAGGKVLISGKIEDVERGTSGGFVRGSALVEGLEAHADRLLRIEFQNENLVALEDGVVVASVPDIVSVLDAHTGHAVTTENLRYGLRVDVVALPCDPVWRSPAALQLVGPAAFGYHVDPGQGDALASGGDQGEGLG